MNRPCIVLLSAVIAAGCGSTASSSGPASGAPPPTAAATVTSTPTPSPTPVPPKTVADLTADPLPAVAYSDIAAIDPTNASTIDAIPKFVVSYEHQDPGTRPRPGLATNAFLCGAPFKQAMTAEQLAVRETYCLLLATTGWLGYEPAPTDAGFSQARTAYAFAASGVGADGRAWLDPVLAATMPAVGRPPSPAPSPSALRSATDLLAIKMTKVDPQGLALAVRDAVAADPVTALTWDLVSVFQVGSQMLADPGGTNRYPKGYAMDSAIAVCAHGYPGAYNTVTFGATAYDLDMQDACGQLVAQLFHAYRSTGSEADWTAAEFALRMGVQGAPPCASLHIRGRGCPEEWVSGLTRMAGQ